MSLLAGIKVKDDVACTGAALSDQLIALPTSAASVGTSYAVHHVFVTSAGKLRVVLQTPALAIGGSYSIPIAVYRVN